MADAIRIVPARSEEQMTVAAELFHAYAKSLGIDLTFQDFSTEVHNLPGKYAAPDGEILLAYGRDAEQPLGCVALRPLSTGGSIAERHCEMKRLYVTPAARGTGVGKMLANQIARAARARGYHEMRLDTLASMQAARNMYRTMGFVEIEAYYATPIEGTVFLSLDLTKSEGSEPAHRAQERDSGG